MVVVKFEKVIKSGLNNGLTVTDRIRFPDRSSAENWIDDVKQFDKSSTYIRFEISDPVNENFLPLNPWENYL